MAKAATKAQAQETAAPKKDKATIVDLEMNLEDYDDFEILPDGQYPATCTLAELRVSDKGNEYYYTTWKINANDYPPDYARENNPEGTNLNFSRLQKVSAGNRRSITAMKNFYRAIGLKLATSKINPGDWEGRRAKLNVGHGEFGGEMRNQVDSIEALDE